MMANNIHGFSVTASRKLPELDAVLYEMIHEKTGLKLVWLKREEENKTFGIAFETLPWDDTGVFHILEHSVLCGSDKYPVKEPFVELMKSSMNTFLNAMTFQDKTFYPISSRNNKDFVNLMRVYLDAVFFPLIYSKPEIFYQEGWHYELDENGNVSYTEWIRECFLFSEESVRDFQKYLHARFLFYREQFRKDGTQCHGRVPETVAQLEIGMEFFLRFLHEQGGFADDWCRGIFERFQSILTRLAKKQSDSIDEDKPTHVFIHKLFSLLESEKVCLLKKNEIHDFVPQHCIGYEDEAWFYLHTDIAHRMVRKLCDEQGECFTIKPKGLLKALAEEDLIKTSAGQNTVSIRINGKSRRVMCLDKHKAELITEEAL